MSPRRTLFVTGTDTEVGKTLIACALLTLARERGLTCLGLKPVAAGCFDDHGQWRNDDALALMSAAQSDADYQTVNPVALEPPIAPHIALQLAGRRVSAAELAAHCRAAAAAGADFVIVEGAGGWLVPIDDRDTLAEVCIGTGADVILVVGMKLGCLNHALLTERAVRSSGLQLAGWVANSTTGTMPHLDANVTTLKKRLEAPCLGVVPHLEDGAGAEAFLDIDPLLA